MNNIYAICMHGTDKIFKINLQLIEDPGYTHFLGFEEIDECFCHRCNVLIPTGVSEE